MRYILFALLICALSLTATAQTAAPAKSTAPNGYCLMRVFDVNKFAAQGSGFVGAKIIITYESGDQETVDLQSFSEKTEPGNLKTIVATLNKLKAKGYMLMSANSTGDQGNIVTDYVLLKQAY